MTNSKEIISKKNELERLNKLYNTLKEKSIYENKQILNLTSENADLETRIFNMNEELKSMNEMKAEHQFLRVTVESLMIECESLRLKTGTVVDECETF